MNSHAQHRLAAANETIAARLDEAARERLAAQTSRRRTLRRSIGRSIIRIGERLAAEPSLSPARSIRG
jgi:hypothetical protein